MTVPYDDLGALDDWLLKQGIEQAERGISVENVLIPATVARFGQAYVYLYATAIFDGEVANGGLPQFFENASGALAPCVRDALQEMELRAYAVSLTQLIAAFGPDYPRNQWVRVEKIGSDTSLQEMLDRGYHAIDVWSREFILARANYARKNRILK
ncbi:DUF4375 domain-containing protein [Sinorhizobium sp. RAC02]|uniref:DMP19 family protein n=1 Tax=Sinorhizobium sp. RAC02 TaxID=1842534 RepID=UPI00083D976F|nr:DUF4375 domain-containing protein [Sinorhizobium sp. RAC02]AOF89057.1 hypothetical protein BSY16_969 [Sinorhizobium sp. RAC02]